MAEGLVRRNRALVVHFISEWENGKFRGQDDSTCLQEAANQGLTLVTYDRRTTPPLLKAWAEEERSHGGVVFIDEKTISQSDIGGLVWALNKLATRPAEKVEKTTWHLHIGIELLNGPQPRRHASQVGHAPGRPVDGVV